ncbi:MjaI family restriction endonuclease [Dictyoglomus thermophilum]|jgi:hypothetical protein|uniref:Uncharacterized protein n=1 Tax=Dictyoglomus thermophilum (strain ATCC 35947 / DSM 3960 / H-6-12) TaxID=309799 RepID=B5YBM5_DICT6|nr:MjaI family restriction endonuclease [Dictyoglomus thermophilum]ACI20119.1 conserved hypothetical protein [Dictyoglomus thermophilum H-6-12]
MPKEWILNMATNRWGLNKKESVGPVALWIRECDPKNVEEWRTFYYKRLGEFLQRKGINLSSSEYLTDLGRKLYVKISEVMKSEIENITEEDCVNYIYELVIKRTFEGYRTEIETIYGQLQNILEVEIKPAPDKWDRLYNYEQTPEIYKWKEWLSRTHERFEKEVGGKVFIIFSLKRDKKRKF